MSTNKKGQQLSQTTVSSSALALARESGLKLTEKRYEAEKRGLENFNRLRSLFYKPIIK